MCRAEAEVLAVEQRLEEIEQASAAAEVKRITGNKRPVQTFDTIYLPIDPQLIDPSLLTLPAWSGCAAPIQPLQVMPPSDTTEAEILLASIEDKIAARPGTAVWRWTEKDEVGLDSEEAGNPATAGPAVCDDLEEGEVVDDEYDPLEDFSDLYEDV